jgi:hypothetical protein
MFLSARIILQFLMIIAFSSVFACSSFAEDLKDQFRENNWPYPRLFNPNPLDLNTSQQIKDEIYRRFSNDNLNNPDIINWYDIFRENASDGNRIDGHPDLDIYKLHENSDFPETEKYHPWAKKLYDQASYFYVEPEEADWEIVANKLAEIKMTGFNFPGRHCQIFDIENNYDFGMDENSVTESVERYLVRLNSKLYGSDRKRVFQNLGHFRGRDLIYICKTYDLLKGSGYLDHDDFKIIESQIRSNIQRTATELYFSHRLMTLQILNELPKLLIDENNLISFNTGDGYGASALVLAALILNDQQPIHSDNSSLNSMIITKYSDPVNWFEQGLGDLRMLFNATDSFPNECRFFTPTAYPGYWTEFHSDGTPAVGAEHAKNLIRDAIFAYRGVSCYLIQNGLSPYIVNVKFDTHFDVDPDTAFNKSFVTAIGNLTGMDESLMPTEWFRKRIEYFYRTQLISGVYPNFEESNSEGYFPYGLYLNENTIYNLNLSEVIYSVNKPGINENSCYNYFVNNLIKDNVLFEANSLIQGFDEGLYLLFSRRNVADQIVNWRKIYSLSLLGKQKIFIPESETYAVYRSKFSPKSLFLYVSGSHDAIYSYPENGSYNSWRFSKSKKADSNFNINRLANDHDDNMSFILAKNEVPIYVEAGYPRGNDPSKLTSANNSNSIEWFKSESDNHEPTIGIAPQHLSDIVVESFEKHENRVQTSIIKTSGYYLNNDPVNDVLLTRTFIMFSKDKSDNDLIINWDNLEFNNPDNRDWFKWNLIINKDLNEWQMAEKSVEPFIYRKNRGCALSINENNYKNSVDLKFMALANINDNISYGNYISSFERTEFNDIYDFKSGTYLESPDKLKYTIKVRRPNTSSPLEIFFSSVHTFEDWNSLDWEDSGVKLYANYCRNKNDRKKAKEVQDGVRMAFRSSKNFRDAGWYAGRSILNRSFDVSDLHKKSVICDSSKIEVDSYMFNNRGWLDYDRAKHLRRRYRKLSTNLNAVIAYHYKDGGRERIRFVIREQKRNGLTIPHSMLFYDFNDNYILEANESIDLNFYTGDIYQNGKIHIFDLPQENYISCDTNGGDYPELYEFNTFYKIESQSILISCTMPEKAEYEIDLFDLTGKFIGNMIKDHNLAGSYEYEWKISKMDRSTLPSAIYFIKFSSDGFTRTEKIALVR